MQIRSAKPDFIVHCTFPASIPRSKPDWPITGTGNLLRGLGRIAVPISAAMCVVDIAIDLSYTKECREN